MTHRSHRLRLSGRQTAAYRPQVEALEDRTLPSAGALDPSFGVAGKVVTDFGFNKPDVGNEVAVQDDGKIVVVGETVVHNPDFAIARYNADGDLDSSFAGDGTVAFDFGGTSDTATSVAIQEDGRIVVAGYGYRSGSAYDFQLLRLNPDGTLDTTFGVGGKVITDLGSISDQVKGVAIQTVGGVEKIVVAGRTRTTRINQNVTFDDDFALARYNPDGSLDTSFGQVDPANPLLRTGKVVTDFSQSDEEAEDVVIQSDGKIVAAGHTHNDGLGVFFAIARYQSDGTIDSSFGVGGTVSTNFGTGSAHAYAVAIQSDPTLGERIVLAGNAADDMALARYTPTGALDPTFAVDGTFTTSFGNNDDLQDLVIQQDGKIVAAGSAGSSSDFALLRLNAADGSLDATFDGDGKVITDFNDSSEEAYGVALQTVNGAEQLVVAGRLYGFNDTDFALAHYETAGTLTISNVSLAEGNSGTVNATFTVTLSQASDMPVSVTYETADGTANPAIGGTDYQGTSGTLTFDSGETSGTITVVVNGDKTYELDETFVVNLSGAANARIADSQGTGTITNDDPVPAITIADVAALEGDRGTTPFIFTLSLSNDSYQTVTVAYATADGAGRASKDYTAVSGTLAFAPGETTKTITVLVNGDHAHEANELFYMNLSAATNAGILDAQAIASILNDDGKKP